MKQSELKNILHYNPEAGVFTWVKPFGSKTAVGSEAGTLMGHGYRRISINKKFYYAHRLAWLYMHGDIGGLEIDHINGNRSDNRIENLRLATRHQNGKNLKRKVTNKSGLPGLWWNASKNTWEAYISPERKKINLGYYSDFFEAACARKAAEKKYFGDFARSA